MKIKFDSNQQYQLDAIKSVVDVFDGQPLAGGAFEVRFNAMEGELLTELGVGNNLAIDDSRLKKNVKAIQERHGLGVTAPQPSAEGNGQAGTEDVWPGMHFSVEMETGTGKTYVYLRTIYELRRKYGFKKFIIVVPSVAIREGVQKSIDLMQDHFRDLYENQPMDSWVFDSRQVSRLRQFANANDLQVLIMNIDAFNKKDINVIHRENDRLSGREPIEFVQACNPIVIMDEPQNMESDQAKAAISSLNPLCTLRYSATHRNPYNLVYRLDPVKAYDLKLVKRIEVDSVLEDSDYNQPYIHVKSIKATKTKITAKLELDVQRHSGPKRTNVSVSKDGVDLYDLSGERANYEGYIVDEINATPGGEFISFTNGLTLEPGHTHGGHTDDIMRVQVRQTVQDHLEKELAVHRQLSENQRLKVLSLFFIDRVAHYYEQDGRIRQWFVEAYQEMAAKSRYKKLKLPPVEEVHNGYFACSKKGEPKDTTGKTQADDEAYALIMQDKERLLSRSEPLRFIFSHSALREGWDNPNVFQICTLNETRSEIKKRQEIGRGLRLPVQEDGNRCFDPNVNRLTVVANEAYDDFARQLQTEIEEECGVSFGGGRIKNAKDRRKARLKKNWRFDENFLALWEKIKHKTRYRVEYDTKELIRRASRELQQMPAIEAPVIRTQKAAIEMTDEGLASTVLAINETNVQNQQTAIPDLLGYLQRETELTRTTLADILIESNRLDEVAKNPQEFMDQAARAVRQALDQLIIDGIKYERIEGAEYEMMLFEEKEIEGYASRMLEVKSSIYDAIEYDSENEKDFARALDERDDVKLFLKLPPWFTVETPLGQYNPDWAIVKQPEGEDAKLYLVRETKTSKDKLKLRGTEWGKLQCGKAHFDALGVDFDHVTSPEEV